MKINLLTLKFQTCMNFFLLLNTKEDILKNVRNQKVDGPIDFHSVPNSKYLGSISCNYINNLLFTDMLSGGLKCFKFLHVFIIIAAVQTSLFL